MNQYRYIDSVIYWDILNTIGVAYTGHVMRPPLGKNEMTEKKGESKNRKMKCAQSELSLIMVRPHPTLLTQHTVRYIFKRISYLNITT